MALAVSAIGIVLAPVKRGVANLAHNMPQLAWLRGKAAPA
jgi:hypothetical protein